MKDCFGNYMIYPICQGHHDCNAKGCYIKTMTEKGPCDCPYKGSCHLIRQRLQTEFREKYRGQLEGYEGVIEDCEFYKLLKPMYEKKKGEEIGDA